MSEIILSSSVSSSLPVPGPKEEINIRPATMDDLGFVDELHKKYNKNLGFATFETLRGKINLGQMIIAESSGERVGYLIGQDRYLKRDELGVVYHLVVKETKQRGFIGAALLKAQFERSEYGCRLYCCWCAQDLSANLFWESMGFYPLAYRMGSEKRGKNGTPRVHIFWQKKIRGKDDAINWWFPHKTDQGAIRADRLVFPVPPGVHWKDVKPIELPIDGAGTEKVKSLPTKRKIVKIVQPAPVSNKMWFASPANQVKEIVIIEKPEKKPKVKIDPKFIAVARELRDRYLEQVNEHGFRLESVGKYEVVKTIAPNQPAKSMPLLEAA